MPQAETREHATQITTRTEKIWMDDGIIHCVALREFQDLADAKENMMAVAQLAAGIPRPVLVDLRNGLGTTGEVRSYYSSEVTAQYQCAAAILVANPISRMMGNFFLGLNRLRYPTKLFTDDNLAVQWLRDFRPPTPSQ